MKTPRLRVITSYPDRDSIVHGDFADGPRGRQEARECFASENEQDNFRQDFGRDALDRHPSLKEGKLGVERVFSDGTQDLDRVPHIKDHYPSTLAEARGEEAAYIAHLKTPCFNDWGQQNTYVYGGHSYSERGPLTIDEQVAHRRRLLRDSDALRSERDSREIDASLPPARHAETSSTSRGYEDLGAPDPQPVRPNRPRL